MLTPSASHRMSNERAFPLKPVLAPIENRGAINEKASTSKGVLLPWLPLVEFSNNLFPTSETSIIDDEIPTTMNLPLPMAPINVQSKPQRNVPVLIPIRDLISFPMPNSPIGSIEKRSKTSQFILDTLDKIQAETGKPDQTVPHNTITNLVDETRMDYVDESFGHLHFSDSESSE